MKLLSAAARSTEKLTQWALPFGIIVVWEALSLAGVIPQRIMPAPTAVIAAAWKLTLSGELLRNVWVSFWRAIVGLAIGGGIGFALGLANGLSRRSEQIFDSTLQMVRNIPHLALIPLVILWFGIDEEAKIFLVALGVFFPIYINTQHGIRSVDGQLIEMATPTACRRPRYSGALSCRERCHRSSSGCATPSASCGSR